MRTKERAWLELNMDNLEWNVAQIRQRIPAGCNIMAVVKADAYGHGAVLIARHLQAMNIQTFAVATLDEGIELRNQGISGDILILGYTPPMQCHKLLRYRLTQTIVDAVYGKELNDCLMHLHSFGRKLKVHIKINSGMNRIGIRAEEYAAVTGIYAMEKLEVTGIFSHLATADSSEPEDVAFARDQIACFNDLIGRLRADGCNTGKVHLQSSYGVLNYPELCYDYVRIGIFMFGAFSHLKDQRENGQKADDERLDLRPVMALKAKIAMARRVTAGEYIGYGRAYIAEEDMDIAVITAGYAEGLPRCLSGGQVLLDGIKAPIVGRICMDQLMVDVTEINEWRRTSGQSEVAGGEDVVILGRDGEETIYAEELAEQSGSITNEWFCRLGKRLGVKTAVKSHVLRSKRSDSKRSDIDRFRLIAALLIVAIHTSPLLSVNETLDFVIVREIARIAVPFFMMVSGYFLIPHFLQKPGGNWPVLWKFVLHTGGLYLLATVIYLPMNIYAGLLKGINPLKLILFDGTFYHLWYLPAVLLGLILICWLLVRLKMRTVLYISCGLYIIGLLGDSYYGLVQQNTALKLLYDFFFSFSEYTRNGLFYAPIFLLLGALSGSQRIWSRRGSILACSLAMAAMIGEGLGLHYLDWQRHDSMYLLLPLVMWFLMRVLLTGKGRTNRLLRQLSMVIYILHPMVILLVRGVAKVLKAEVFLVRNSLVHYLSVCVLTVLLSVLIIPILAKIKMEARC